jgi:hypothetical protein
MLSQLQVFDLSVLMPLASICGQSMTVAIVIRLTGKISVVKEQPSDRSDSPQMQNAMLNL